MRDMETPMDQMSTAATFVAPNVPSNVILAWRGGDNLNTPSVDDLGACFARSLADIHNLTSSIGSRDGIPATLSRGGAA
jgi:hypothetical protein